MIRYATVAELITFYEGTIEQIREDIVNHSKDIARAEANIKECNEALIKYTDLLEKIKTLN